MSVFLKVAWGLGGVLFLLGFAVYRLGLRALEAWGTRSDWNWSHWTLLIVFALFMAVAEGYRGFQKKFSPRTAARIRCSTPSTDNRLLLR